MWRTFLGMSFRTLWFWALAFAALVGCRKDAVHPTPENRVPVLPEVEFEYSALSYPESWLAAAAPVVRERSRHHRHRCRSHTR